MKASRWEFRFRMWLIVLLLFLGFWSPWIEYTNWGTRTTAWLWLGFEISRLGVTSTTGIQIVTILAIIAAAIAAAFRVWGTAYLGTGIVNNSRMKAGAVFADGPYRYVRNPLYIGSWFMTAAIAVLMPPTGALLVMIAISIFLFRLILGEEAFLMASLGEPYLTYCKAVPRLIPSLRTRVPASGQQPNWGRALLAEITPLGVLLSFAILSWRYDARLLTRAVLVSFGVSLVTRALLPSTDASQEI